MNVVMLMGRLTRDPEVRTTTGNEPMTIARYTLAVDRRTKEKATDFINCVCFGKNAEFAEKYLRQGMKIVVEGRIQTGSYTNRDGKKVYTTDVVVEGHEFAESKGEKTETKAEPKAETRQDGFMPIPDDMPDLPFN